MQEISRTTFTGQLRADLDSAMESIHYGANYIIKNPIDANRMTDTIAHNGAVASVLVWAIELAEDAGTPLEDLRAKIDYTARLERASNRQGVSANLGSLAVEAYCKDLLGQLWAVVEDRDFHGRAVL